MSYTPTNWQVKDKITAERLNKIEQGIEDASSIITFITYGGDGLLQSYNDMVELFEDKKLIVMKEMYEIGPLNNRINAPYIHYFLNYAHNENNNNYSIGTTTGGFYSSDPDDGMTAPD